MTTDSTIAPDAHTFEAAITPDRRAFRGGATALALAAASGVQHDASPAAIDRNPVRLLVVTKRN